MLIPFDVAVLFFLAACALALAPGPDNLFVLTQAALFGRRAGILVTLGLCTGLLFHTAAVALGVVAIFQSSPLAFNGLKILGAVYLLYLAWQIFRADTSALAIAQVTEMNSRALYLRGVIMNLTNPKVAIFFLAFLPQFAAPARGSITSQMLILGGLFIIAAMSVFSAVALVAGILGDRIRESQRAHLVLNRIAGVVFVALAVKLLVSGH